MKKKFISILRLLRHKKWIVITCAEDEKYVKVDIDYQMNIETAKGCILGFARILQLQLKTEDAVNEAKEIINK